MNTLLLLDTETGGLDPRHDPLLEVACVLWSIEHASITGAWSTLVRAESNEAEEVNRIPSALVRCGAPVDRVLAQLQKYANTAEVLIAHQADFDRSFLPDLGKPWVCSCEDLKWPRSKQGASLVTTALDHDIGVVSAHRALSDCLTLARLFERVTELGHDVRAMVTRGLRPKAEFVADVPRSENQKVKDAGFKWFPDEKLWKRTLPVEDAAELGFKVKQLQRRQGEDKNGRSNDTESVGDRQDGRIQEIPHGPTDSARQDDPGRNGDGG